ncbi:MAG: hypothetical protein AAGH88_00340 [Planctomycetota bacterium]
MKQPTRSNWLSLLAILSLLTHASAGLAQDAPFTGVITRNTVEIRSGAGLAFYEVGQLEKNQVVRVEEILFNNAWYKIRVPEGIYSYISKAFVNAQGDGSIGVISDNETEVLAASLRGPGVSYRVQTLLDRGTRVTIVAEEGSYYKVEPPEDAYVFIPAGTLRVATAADIQTDENPQAQQPTEQETDEPTETPQDPPNENDTPQQEPGEGEPPAHTEGESEGETEGEGETETVPEPIDPPAQPEEGTTDPADPPAGTDTETEAGTHEQGTPREAASELPPAPEVEVSTQARSEALKAVEMELLPYFYLPLEDRPLSELERRYRRVAAENELGRVDQQIVAIRLRAIQSQQRALEAIMRSRQARESQPVPERDPVEADLPQAPVSYSEVGILGISTQYDGTNLPLLYRLISPSGRTIAYIEPGDHIDTGTMLDNLVGVVGPRRYDTRLKLHVITVERADVLTPRDEE